MNLKKDLTIDILSSVQKPARYTGGEFASIVKPAEEVEATIALAFPDVYEVGMSYLGFKILYHLLNKEDGIAAERVYAPWIDLEAKMREREIVLCTLETKKALKNHSNLREIVLCVDNDEGGIEAVDRLRDILHENGYPNVKRLAPEFKDWNECLKSQNGVEPLPAVPHKRKDEYLKEVSELGYLKCRPDKLTSQIYATFKNGQYKYLAEYALAGSAFFMPKSERINSECKAFERLQHKLKGSYKPYTDKGKKAQKQRNLQDCVHEVLRDLKQTDRTREQSINTAKLLYQLADNAVRMSVEEASSVPVQEQTEDIDIVSEPEPCMEFG